MLSPVTVAMYEAAGLIIYDVRAQGGQLIDAFGIQNRDGRGYMFRQYDLDFFNGKVRDLKPGARGECIGDPNQAVDFALSFVSRNLSYWAICHLRSQE